ncbi:MAG: DUF4139 domain-containing protein [Bacteroidetes bacterium]|nr:DUF4139 domain-containing protein [Bacteroidota bacterium]
MKKFSIVLLLLTLNLSVIAQNQKTLKSSVKEVCVFTSGAQIQRSANINIPAGVSELVFDGISPYANVSSIQSSGKGNFIILDTRHNIKYSEPAENPESLIPASLQHKINATQDTLNEINFDFDAIKDKKDLYNKQKDMLYNNPLMRGGGKSDSLPVLMAAMDFYNTKMSNINTELQKIKRDEAKILTKKTQLQKRLNDLNDYKNRIITEKTGSDSPRYQIIVSVSAREAVTGSLTVSYLTSNAGWSASYDIRVNDINAPLELALKANVYQNTGENWENVKLKLSTNNPTVNNIKPYLSSWLLNYFMPVTGYTSNIVMKSSKAEAPQSAQGNYDDAKLPAAERSYKYITQSQSLTAIEYNIDLPYSIPDDGKPHLVYVQQNENIITRYNYYAAPKIDKDAFLIAKLSGWEELNLLAAKANIYFEGSYVGETTIDPTTITDTLELSLGRDKSISIQRKKLRDKEKDQIIGNSRLKTITMEITVKNNKNASIDLSLEDQIPIANDKDIKVNFIADDFTGKLNETTGLLSWNLKLKPKETKTVSFTYSIKYDSDKSLILK